MKLWIDASHIGASGSTLQAKVEEMTARVNQQILSRGARAVNQLRNAELEVLRGRGGGRVYRKPHSRATYRASAPGEPPARRTGNLRLHWNGNVTGGDGSITIELESQEDYAGYLEDGTSKMVARPFKDRITEKALPAVTKIFEEPYV